MTMQIEVPETTVYRESGRDWLMAAKSYAVVDKESLDSANSAILAIRSAKKVVGDKLDPAIKAAHTAHRTLTSLKAEILQPFEEAEAQIKSRCAAFLDNVRREEQRKRDEAIAAERARQEEERLQRAEQLEKLGRIAEASAEIVAPIEIREPAIPSIEPPKGMHTREIWSARVDSMLALVRHIAEHPEYINLVMPNMSALNDLARAQKASMNLPGVTSEVTTTVVSR